MRNMVYWLVFLAALRQIFGPIKCFTAKKVGKVILCNQNDVVVFSSFDHLFVQLRDPALQLAVGGAMADALLGPASPYKGLWYERNYPMRVPPGASEAAAHSTAGRWVAERFTALLTHKPGQVKPPPTMLPVSIWALAMARRFTPPPVDLLPPEIFINLLTENDGWFWLFCFLLFLPRIISVILKCIGAFLSKDWQCKRW